MAIIHPQSDSPHQRNLRVGRWSEQYSFYGITKCVDGRLPVLANDEAAKVLLDAFAFLRSRGDIRLIAYCIMPDHYHALLCLIGARSVSNVIASHSKFTGRQLNSLGGTAGSLWQEGFHDRRCRDEREILDLTAYFEHNPVRAGFVTRAEEWRYSSAHPTSAMHVDREWYNNVR
jgi:putative transposase